MNILKLKFGFLSLLAILSVSILMTSCEQETLISTIDTLETSTEEGFKSTTNNANNTTSPIADGAVAEKPLLYARFSSDMTAEEVEEQWGKMVDDYVASLNTTEQLENRGVSTEWFSSVRTRTGTQTYNDTDATVYARLGFRSDLGNSTHSWYELDNFGDDREKGDWDVYLFRSYISGQAVSWVEASWGQLALYGTDGWFVTDFDVYVHPVYQSIGSSGASYIFAAPNVWLDNASSTAWDYYYTGTIGFGRLNF